MSKKLLNFCWPLLVLTVPTGIIAKTGADLAISCHFYRNSGWPVGYLSPWREFYLYGYYPAYVLAAAAFGLYLVELSGLINWRIKKTAVYLVLLLLLGPGLAVNTTFKDHWGRPRPREITQFGGSREFQQPWQPSQLQGRSFPSGHAASAFYLAMPYFVLRRRRPGAAYLVYGAGIAYGILMGIARIAQGGHFLSDILWAWGIVHMTAVVLYYLMGLDRQSHSGGC